MQKKVTYLSPNMMVTILCNRSLICSSNIPTISGSYSGNLGDEGTPGGDISGDDIIDGGAF